MKEQKHAILDIRNLSISFTQYDKGMTQIQLPVITDLSVKVHEGEMVAIVGSSGSGKSLLAHAVLGILPYNAVMGGSIYYRQEYLNEELKKKLRGKEIVLVPQSVSNLDPLMRVGEQIRKGKKDKASIKRSREILYRYGMDEETEKLYPFELSGGMSRRILISTAVVEKPELVIADEPTPGLHIDTAKRILGHFREIADDGAGVLIITHDLELALEVADRVVVFYAGTTIEDAAASDFMSEDSLRHPYSRALYRAMPQHGFHAAAGTQPYVKDMPQGCPYAARCEQAKAECRNHISYREWNGGWVRCILLGGDEES